MPKIEYTPDGKEIPDPTPVEIPLGYRKPETLVQMMQRMIRQDVSRYAVDNGAESFDEANDFDEEDDDAELHGTAYEDMGDDIPRGGSESGTSDSRRRGRVREGDESEGEDDEAGDGDERPRDKSKVGRKGDVARNRRDDSGRAGDSKEKRNARDADAEESEGDAD